MSGTQDERRMCVRRSRVVLASVADVKLAEIDRPNRAQIDRQFANDGGKKELVTGESAR
jgi:hypothetical protein